MGTDNNPEPLEIEVFIRRGTDSGAIVHEEVPHTSGAVGKGSPYVHGFTTNLSDANKRGLDSMAYWGTGPRKSKTYLINQALTHYLAQYKEAQRPLPLDGA